MDPTNPDSPIVCETLINKHPKGQIPLPKCILPSLPQELHPVLNALDANTICSASLHITGSAGPCLDDNDWRRLCTSFSGASDEFCHQLAMVARRLCTEHVNPSLITPFLACRLITLNKNPGVHRIIAKVVLSIVKSDIQDASLHLTQAEFWNRSSCTWSGVSASSLPHDCSVCGCL